MHNHTWLQVYSDNASLGSAGSVIVPKREQSWKQCVILDGSVSYPERRKCPLPKASHTENKVTDQQFVLDHMLCHVSSEHRLCDH